MVDGGWCPTFLFNFIYNCANKDNGKLRRRFDDWVVLGVGGYQKNNRSSRDLPKNARTNYRDVLMIGSFWREGGSQKNVVFICTIKVYKNLTKKFE